MPTSDIHLKTNKIEFVYKEGCPHLRVRKQTTRTV
jgi:hypothetical protein